MQSYEADIDFVRNHNAHMNNCNFNPDNYNNNDLGNVKYRSWQMCDVQYQLAKFREDIGNLTEICTNTINTVIDLSNEIQILKAQFTDFKLSCRKKNAIRKNQPETDTRSDINSRESFSAQPINFERKKKKRKPSKVKVSHVFIDHKNGNHDQFMNNETSNQINPKIKRSAESLLLFSNTGKNQPKCNDKTPKKQNHISKVHKHKISKPIDESNELEVERNESLEQRIPVKLINDQKKLHGSSGNINRRKNNNVGSTDGNNNAHCKELVYVSQPVMEPYELKNVSTKNPTPDQIELNEQLEEKLLKCGLPKNFQELREMLNCGNMQSGNSKFKQEKSNPSISQRCNDFKDSNYWERFIVEYKQRFKPVSKTAAVKNQKLNQFKDNVLEERSISTTTSRGSSQSNENTTMTRSAETKEMYSSDKSSNDTLKTLESKISNSSTESETESDSKSEK